MANENLYDCAFVGAGLAGLTSAIQLSVYGYKVIVFEKETFPFHKVCGEYISMESRDYLQSLGLELDKLQLPEIKKLIVSAPSGNTLKQDLPLGGFGISRYLIDDLLKKIATEKNVTVMDNCKVDDIWFGDEQFTVQTAKGTFFSKTCCGSFGKKSNIDVKWKRPFLLQTPNKLNNYIGVKYHIKTDFADDCIALHNFKNGYCGISKIEDDKFCLCYLTTAANLKQSNHHINEMEKNILSANPHLKNIFQNSIKLFEKPLSISQISFQQKSPVENHVLMIGDAAGMITPLCGNGMSMAMHAGKIAAAHIHLFLQNGISRDDMEISYAKEWHKTFGKRLRAGRIIQGLFGKPLLTNVFIWWMKKLPGTTRWLIRQTHGKPF